MLTLPTMIEIPAQPYVAGRQKVDIPVDQHIDSAMDELLATMEKRKLQVVWSVFGKDKIVTMHTRVL